MDSFIIRDAELWRPGVCFLSQSDESSTSGYSKQKQNLLSVRLEPLQCCFVFSPLIDGSVGVNWTAECWSPGFWSLAVLPFALTPHISGSSSPFSGHLDYQVSVSCGVSLHTKHPNNKHIHCFSAAFKQQFERFCM